MSSPDVLIIDVIEGEGVPGPTGPPGPEGPPGVAGSPGPGGPQGPQGTQGPRGDTGPQGTPGTQGAQGIQGAQGPAGSQGPTGSPGQSFVFIGPYDPATNYQRDYVVIGGDGNNYIVTNNAGVTGVNPVTDTSNGTVQGTYWSLFTLRGLEGPAGAQGPQGSQGPTGAQGPQGNTGAAGAPGAQGPQGAQGNPGPTGPAGPQGALDFKTIAALPDVLIVGAVTRSPTEAATSAAVTWPDGTPGTYTGTESTTWPGAVDSYTITYGSPVTETYAQPAVTRDANGAVTARPAITRTP